MMKKLLAGLLLGIAVISTNSVVANAEWKLDPNNKWRYEENGQAAYGWKFIDGNWYNFANNGIMQTGWIKGDNNTWYYCWSNGTMAKNSWLTNGGLWYYFDDQGRYVMDKVNTGSKTYYFTAPAIITTREWGHGELNKEEAQEKDAGDSEEVNKEIEN